MQTTWNYTALAPYYDRRAEYAPNAIDRLVEIAGLSRGDRVADIGAGTAKLTRPLVARGLRVHAVEPNDAMRAIGIENTRGADVCWSEGTGEQTGLPDHGYAMVFFGSSFNVVDRAAALREVARIAVVRGWFGCLWNHRDLDDPLQKEVEATITAHVPDYGHGVRREDQTAVIDDSGLFEAVDHVEARSVAPTRVEDYIDAWRSHATLQRQAGEAFDRVVDAIRRVLPPSGKISVPYTTRCWVARLRK